MDVQTAPLLVKRRGMKRQRGGGGGGTGTGNEKDANGNGAIGGGGNEQQIGRGGGGGDELCPVPEGAELMMEDSNGCIGEWGDIMDWIYAGISNCRRKTTTHNIGCIW
jgi:hypothetical protein